MNESHAATTGVALIGMGGTDHGLLSSLLNVQRKGVYKVVAIEDAQIGVFDFDDPACLAGWPAFRRRHPELAVIGLSLGENGVPNGVKRVGKPVRAESFLAIVDEMAARAPPQAAPHTSRITRQARRQTTRSLIHAMDPLAGLSRAASTNARENSSFDPTRVYTFIVSRTLREVLGDGRARAIESNLQFGKPIIVTPEHGGTIRTRISNGMLRQMCTIPLDDQQVVVRHYDRADWIADAAGAVTAESFLWKTALWSSHGRLPSDIRSQDMVALKRWPNLTRLAPINHSMRIAALWSRGPTTPAYTAKALEIDLATVSSFCYAAHVTGLLQVTATSAVRHETGIPPALMAAATFEQIRQRGLFSRIINYLVK